MIGSDRVLVEVAAETTYGSDPGGGSQLTLYNPQLPVQYEAEADRRERAWSWSGPVEVPNAPGFFRWPTLQTYLAAGTANNAPPSWATLLTACGFRLTEQSADKTEWQGPYDLDGSVTLRGYFGHRKVRTVGVRGTWALNAFAGRPVPLQFSMAGKYEDSSFAALPSSTASPGIPPAWCGTAFYLLNAAHGNVTPPIISCSIDCGMGVAARRPALTSGAISAIEWERSGAPRMQTVFEARPTDDWIQVYRAGTPYYLNFVLTHGTGGWFFQTPDVTGPTATLGPTPPVWVEQDGIVGWQLEWTLAPDVSTGAALVIQQYGTG